MLQNEHITDTTELPVRDQTGLVIVFAAITGIALAWIDTRPGWDDTGVTVGLVFLFSALLGALMPRRPWLAALAVGVWIPLANIIFYGNFGSAVALVIAFLGAFAGAGVRKIFVAP
jgi:uncharacterized membrane protein